MSAKESSNVADSTHTTESPVKQDEAKVQSDQNKTSDQLTSGATAGNTGRDDLQAQTAAVKKAMKPNEHGNVFHGPITLEQHKSEVEIITTYALCVKTDLATSRPVPPSSTVTASSFKQEVWDTIQKLEDSRDSMKIAGERHPDLTKEFVTKANDLRNFLVDAYNAAEMMENDTAIGGKFAATLAVLIASL